MMNWFNNKEVELEKLSHIELHKYTKKLHKQYALRKASKSSNADFILYYYKYPRQLSSLYEGL